MSQNIIFLGGIHGVGKTTYSDFIKQHIPSIDLLSCSQVLQWKDPKEKEVANVDENQNRLVTNLSKILSPNKHYLLDGHFCLRNTNGEIEPIGIETFRAIDPAMIVLLEEDASVIQERLQERDGKDYAIEDLKEFAKMEKEQASLVAKELNVPLFCIPSSKPETHLREIVSFRVQESPFDV